MFTSMSVQQYSTWGVVTVAWDTKRLFGEMAPQGAASPRAMSISGGSDARPVKQHTPDQAGRPRQ